MGRYRRSGEICIDVSGVLDQVGDDDLLDELRARKLSVTQPGETVDMDIVREAYDAINRSALVEARTILDRVLFPKWKTLARCEQEYRGFFKS